MSCHGWCNTKVSWLFHCTTRWTRIITELSSRTPSAKDGEDLSYELHFEVSIRIVSITHRELMPESMVAASMWNQRQNVQLVYCIKYISWRGTRVRQCCRKDGIQAGEGCSSILQFSERRHYQTNNDADCNRCCVDGLFLEHGGDWDHISKFSVNGTCDSTTRTWIRGSYQLVS